MDDARAARGEEQRVGNVTRRRVVVGDVAGGGLSEEPLLDEGNENAGADSKSTAFSSRNAFAKSLSS